MDSNLYEVVRFANIDSEDFTGVFGGQKTIVKAKEVKMFPRFLGEHYAKQLATKILMREGKEWGNDSIELKEKIKEITSNVESQVMNVEEVVQDSKEEEFSDLKKKKRIA